MLKHASEESVRKMRKYVEKYWEKTGTSPHPDPEVTGAVVQGLALHVDELGRPLCPCNFYPDKKQEVAESRRWICACDEMKQYKYCHCLLFVTPEGLPITEHLPEGHEGRTVYGLVLDPTPLKGREGAKDRRTP
jgi:ferredoxin-thioredoxin reductase catalytic chain